MSEDHAARPHPPSSRRSAEARAQGHLPRAPLAGFVLALLSLVASVYAHGPRVLARSTSLFREPLELAAQGQSALARERALFHLSQLLTLCAPALVAVVVSVAVGLVVVQGPAFAGGPRVLGSFPALSVSRTASVLWCAGVLLIASLALGQWALLDLRTLGESARGWAGQLVVLCVAALLVDVSFARARFQASLWLTRREFHDEQRAALGPPEARAARARQRQSFFHGRAERPAAGTREGARGPRGARRSGS